MIVVERATEEDLPDIYAIDAAQGFTARIAYLTNTVRERQMLIARRGDTRLGFAVVSDTFFGQPFIWLVVVEPTYRRQGVATALIAYIEKTRPGNKLFTSTHQSNAAAQALLERLGFVRSGLIEHLDEGDPEIIYFKRLER